MKEYKWTIILVLVLVASNAFWIYKESASVTWEERLEESCQQKLAGAADSFSNWLEKPSDIAYYQGVSFFYAAWLDYGQLYPNTISDLEANKLNALLMQEPELCQENMQNIVNMVRQWKQDLDGVEASSTIRALVETIQELAKE